MIDLDHLRPLMLLGMHRSGTSLTTRILRDLGIYMGRFWMINDEAINFQMLNRRIFAVAGGRWSEVEPVIEALDSPDFMEQQAAMLRQVLYKSWRLRYSELGTLGSLEHHLWRYIVQRECSPWGWKDPRTTITFPVWLRIFPQARVVHILRNGIDVAISTNRRTRRYQQEGIPWWGRSDYSPDTLAFERCFELWERYVGFALEHLNIIPPEQYLEIRYEALLVDPTIHIRRIMDFLEYPVSEAALVAACAQVNAGRLNNAAHAAAFREQIPTLASSALMARLGYTYDLPPGPIL